LNFLSFSSFEIWKWSGAKGCECELFFSKKLLWEQGFILGFKGVPTFLQKFEDNLERDNGNLEWISQDSCVGLLTVWLYRRGFSIVEKIFW
jgi:hypothetical protein